MNFLYPALLIVAIVFFLVFALQNPNPQRFLGFGLASLATALLALDLIGRKVFNALIIVGICFSLSGCAFLQTEQQKATAWSNSTGGKITLAAVQTAANLFEPQYAGVLGIAINSLQTATVPTPAATQSIIASVTGSNPTEAKVATLAAAVIDAASAAPSPNVGLAQAAATVSK